MKRILALLVTLAAIGGAAFAQEFKFDGYVNSGIGVLSSDIDDSDTNANPALPLSLNLYALALLDKILPSRYCVYIT